MLPGGRDRWESFDMDDPAKESHNVDIDETGR